MLFWPQEKWCTRTYEEARLALTHLQAASPLHWLHRPLSLSVCLTHSHTQTKTGLQRGQSLISQSFSLRRSQTSLRCSKNKIPAVKLSALRFCAFNAEANQKFEKKKKRERREAHPPWQGQHFQDHAWNVGLLWVCAKVRAHKRKNQLKMQIWRAVYFSSPRNTSSYSWGRVVCMLKGERRPLRKTRGAENAPNLLCSCTGQLPGVNVWISAECESRVLLEN